MATNPGHIIPVSAQSDIPDDARQPMPEDRAINGNTVSVEDEMIKVSQNTADYQLMTNLYKKQLGMLKMAIGSERRRLLRREGRGIMSFDDAMRISASGMTAQGTRLRTISENLANAESTASAPGQDPYRRKVITFHDALDRATGDNLVSIGQITTDPSPFETRYNPGHPAADANGYVQYPNVNSLIEVNDLREAQRSYEANVDVIDAAKTMLSRTIDLLK